MDTPALKIRRGRREDFTAVMRLLAPPGAVEPDRRTLRRFRHIVADLGADLYVADLGGSVVGVVHASYSRQISGAQRARIEGLAADPGQGGRDLERQLLEFIIERARKRCCGTLCCVPATRDAGAVAQVVGLEPRDTEYCRSLAGEA
jgi:N-acetylglutamate synthase-like GNAT family acetyltransferase